MSFTEIAIEVADERHPLCRHTAPPSQVYGLLRIIDQGRSSGRFVSLLSYVGPRDAAGAFVRELSANRPANEVEVVAETDEMTTVRSSVEVGSSNARLMAVVRLLDQLGVETLIEPVIFRAGRMRARFIVPRRLDPQRVMGHLAELQRNAGFREFRVLRIAHLEPNRHLEVMRPLLTPEQDQLLRLAVGMGYYANPKKATLEEIAGRVGLSISPVHKRLKAAEEQLVTAHIGSGPRGTLRRRGRRPAAQPTAPGPCEVDFVARADGHPLARWASTHRARAFVQPLSEDREGQGVALVLGLGEPSALQELPHALRATEGTLVDEAAREDGHVCLRVRGRTEHAWGFTPFAAGFAGDAVVRHIVYDQDEAFVRLLLTRAQPLDDVQGRLAKVAAGVGWRDPEVLHLASTGVARLPLDLPEPLSPRQEEVLKVAHALGYYRTPRSCTLEQVASTLGVSANAIHKNLVGAEAKIIANYLVAGL